MPHVSQVARALILFAAAIGATCAVASAAGAQAATRDPGDQIVLSGRVLVPRGQAVGEVVVFHGRVQIEGVARQDVVVLDGAVVISGQVSGSVIALGGDVDLASTAQVGGDVLASGEVTVAEGAEVGGRLNQHVGFTLRGRLDAVARLVSWFAVSVSTLLLGALLLWIAPRAFDRTDQAIRTAPWAALGWGVLVSIALPVVSIALLASILGLPLGLSVLLGLALIFSIGYATTAWLLGRAILRPPHTRALAFLAGWAIARVVGLVPLVSGVTWGIGAVVGLGALTVAIWRARGTPSRGKHRLSGKTVAAPDEVVIEETASGLA
jgi:hypothetical protein